MRIEGNDIDSNNIDLGTTEQKMIHSLLDNRPIGSIWHGFTKIII
ncbi:10528_t:CDS:2 [Rhizophagus irregularis]|nr:10528_t:CDS:2 [Rhizophagus irregularis]